MVVPYWAVEAFEGLRRCWVAALMSQLRLYTRHGHHLHSQLLQLDQTMAEICLYRMCNVPARDAVFEYGNGSPEAGQAVGCEFGIWFSYR